MSIIKRKGARSTKDIPVAILEQLNQGEIETLNLVEWLAVDQRQLIENLLRNNDRLAYLPAINTALTELKKHTVNSINETIGTTLFLICKEQEDQDFIELMATHRSDLVRCWATYTIGKNPDLSIEATLEAIKPFAADTHFGVREICWLAVRKKITVDLDEAITILSTWTADADANVRRFASECIRPRGVWSAHIDALKDNPALALPILEPLKADPARYVQDSVGNWLNDASKSQPMFVKAVCEKWERESPKKETLYIIKKAMRTINK